MVRERLRRSRINPPLTPPNPRRTAYLRLRGIAETDAWMRQVLQVDIFTPSRAVGLFALHPGFFCVAAFDGEDHWRLVHTGLEPAWGDYQELYGRLVPVGTCA